MAGESSQREIAHRVLRAGDDAALGKKAESVFSVFAFSAVVIAVAQAQVTAVRLAFLPQEHVLKVFVASPCI